MTDLNVTLKFLTDKRSQAEAKAAIDQLSKSTESWAQENKRVVDQLRSDLFSKPRAEIKQLSDQVAQLEQNTKGATESLRKMGTQSRYGMAGIAGIALTMAGRQLSRIGQAGLSPIGQYTSAFGETERVSAAWLQTQERLESVMVRIGRVMAEEMLPTFEKLADLAEKAADFAESHPDAVKAAGTLFGGALIGGGVLTALGGILSGIGGIKALTTLGGAGAAGGAGLLGGLPLGIAAGGAGFWSLPNLIGRKLGGALGIPDYGEQIAWLAKKLGFESGGTTTRTATTAPLVTGGGATTKQLDIYLDYQKKEMDAQVTYHEKRTQLIQSYNQNMLEMERNYQQSRASYIRDFQQNERRIEQSYYRERRELAADYSTDIQRMEEDHQVKMRKLAEDHEYRMEDLVSRRDALGIVREMRDYERQRRDADEEYRLEAGRRSQDFARKLQEMAAQFAIERQYRIQEFQQNLKDMETDYRARRQAAAAEHRKELIDLQNKYNQERIQRRKALISQLEDTAEGLQAERVLRQKFTAAMLADLAAALKSAGVTTSGKALPPARDSGGYMQPGMYRNASGSIEFALSPQTTRAAEQMAAGKLTQASILKMMMGGGAKVTYNDHRRIDGRITPEDRRAIRQDTAELLRGLFA